MKKKFLKNSNFLTGRPLTWEILILGKWIWDITHLMDCTNMDLTKNLQHEIFVLAPSGGQKLFSEKSILMIFTASWSTFHSYLPLTYPKKVWSSGVEYVWLRYWSNWIRFQKNFWNSVIVFCYVQRTKSADSQTASTQ